MLLEMGKALSFFMSILSLYALLTSAFFVPGSHWDERLEAALTKIVLAACVCFASGFFFSASAKPEPPATRTLPVKMFYWALAGMTLLFFLSWYLEEYYVPLLWRNQPH